MSLCSADGCKNNSLAKGFCNAHYLRNKKNKDLNAPLKQRNIDKICVDCGKPTDAKGGFMRCKTHYKIYKKQTLKAKFVDMLGGCCSVCKGKFPLAVYDFHHLENKKDDIASMFNYSSEEKIAEEVKKCILLCANCHRITHAK
jgi:hypothetical protein